MADNKDQFKFDLDARDAIGQLNSIKDQITSIGDVKNLSGLVKGLVSLAGPIAAVGAALFSVKAAFDLAKEGEQLEKIHKQFEAFADSVGVNAKKMSDDIQKSIGTTEDLDDALKAAGQAMVKLGDNSDKIPQFFEIAKKAAQAYGGTVNERFDQISQAVANGNTRMLRSIGLSVEADKAMRAYAASIGSTVGALSEQGRQTAIANALLDKAAEKYKNIKVEQDGIETASKRFSVAWKESGDAIAMAMNKAFGPAFTKAIEFFTAAMNNLGTSIKANFGDGLEKANAQMAQTEKHISSLTAEMEKLKKIYGSEETAKNTAEWRALNQQLDAANAKKNLALAIQEEENRKASAKKGDEIIAAGGLEDKKKDPGVDKQKKLEQEAKFNRELLKLAEARLKDEQEIETNAEQYSLNLEMQKNNMIAQYDAQIAETKRQGMAGETLTKAQADQMIIQMEADKQAKIAAMERDAEENRLKVYDNQVKAAQNASQGISAAFAQGAAQAQHSMKDYGKQGQMVFGSLTKNAANAFRAMGDGSKSAGEAMKGFLFGTIADVSEAKGQFLLASGIGTMNGVEIAQGGALIALAGLLRSQAGGEGGGGVGGASGGGGAGGGGGSGGGGYINDKPQLSEDKKKSVSLQVMGNYFETEQTKTRLMEMIRENTDATDFKYQQIGVG